MCLGDLGVVVGFAPGRSRRDAVVVDTIRGQVEASILMAPDARPGDHVVVHSGHVLQVLDPARADDAALLRRGSTAPTGRDVVHDHAARHGAAGTPTGTAHVGHADRGSREDAAAPTSRSDPMPPASPTPMPSTRT